MKNSKVLVVVLPVLVVVLVFFLANSFIGSKAGEKRSSAESAEQEAKSLERKVARANVSKQKEAELNAELAKIRNVLPLVPEDIASPTIRKISDAARARGVAVTVEDQDTSPISGAADATQATAPAGGGDAKTGQVDPTVAKYYSVKMEVRGPLAGVLDFVQDLPATGRVFVYKVEIQPGGDAEVFNPDYKASADVVKAALELRSYVDASASPTATAAAKK